LAEAFLSQLGPQRIVHDPRLTWNTQDITRAAGGEPVLSKTGHAFIKERMREVDAVYGGEMSAHHYFRDFAYCDSGMIPWLLIANLMTQTQSSLADLVAARAAAFPCSGEINREVTDPQALLRSVRARYEADAVAIETLDGLGLEFADWRFNLRLSNTEPVVRLNVESRADQVLMEEKTAELLALIDG
jgi:phosphomannomutase